MRWKNVKIFRLHSDGEITRATWYFCSKTAHIKRLLWFTFFLFLISPLWFLSLASFQMNIFRWYKTLFCLFSLLLHFFAISISMLSETRSALRLMHPTLHWISLWRIKKLKQWRDFSQISDFHLQFFLHSTHNRARNTETARENHFLTRDAVFVALL